MIPLTSPIVMLIENSVWCSSLANNRFYGITFATFFLVVWFASKIYRVGILMYGKKTNLKEND